LDSCVVQMSRSKGFSLRLIIFIFLLCACIAAMGILWAVQSIPGAVQRSFGAPGPAIGTWQRLTYGARLLIYRDDLLTPLDPKGKERTVRVELGESVASVAQSLEQQGLIRNAEAFRLYLIYAGLDTGMQAGEYQFSPAQSAVQIGQALQDATPQVVTFRILPGWRAEEVAAALLASGLETTPETFLKAVRKPNLMSLPTGLQDLKSAEGFLFPDTYRIKRNTPAQGLLTIFLQRFDDRVSTQQRVSYQQHGLTLRQAVILASIVEREAVVDEEKPLIASVFLNRTEQGMRLESDPTVQYALGFNQIQQTWWTNPISLEDLRVDSPYNTYLNSGLPPGPICSPGLAALKAVAEPAQTSYLYFRARCDGSGKHNFSTTYDEHIRNACP